MITGKTESGFEFELADNIKDDYEVVEALVRYFKKLTYENFVTFKDLMFRGATNCEKRAKDFLRERDGYITVAAMNELVFAIWNAAKELKKLTGFARLLADCGDELICDFAETYGVLDMKALPLRTAAALAVGLRDDCRAKLKLSGRRFGFDQLLQMRIFDCLNWLKWSRSRACELGYSAPPPLEEIIEQNILQAEKREEQRLMGFDSPEELNSYIEKQRQISDNS